MDRANNAGRSPDDAAAARGAYSRASSDLMARAARLHFRSFGLTHQESPRALGLSRFQGNQAAEAGTGRPGIVKDHRDLRHQFRSPTPKSASPPAFSAWREAIHRPAAAHGRWCGPGRKPARAGGRRPITLERGHSGRPSWLPVGLSRDYRRRLPRMLCQPPARRPATFVSLVGAPAPPGRPRQR